MRYKRFFTFILIFLFVLLNYFLDNSFDFRVHFARQHIKNHFIIGNKRPERIFKAGGFIVFDKKMREPGEAVTDNQAKRRINPVAALDNPDKQNNAERRADEMQVAR